MEVAEEARDDGDIVVGEPVVPGGFLEVRRSVDGQEAARGGRGGRRRGAGERAFGMNHWRGVGGGSGAYLVGPRRRGWAPLMFYDKINYQFLSIFTFLKYFRSVLFARL